MFCPTGAHVWWLLWEERGLILDNGEGRWAGGGCDRLAQDDAHLGIHSATQSFHDILHGRCQAQIKNQSVLLLLSLITHSRAEGSLQRKLAPSQALGLMGLRRIPFSGLLCFFFQPPAVKLLPLSLPKLTRMCKHTHASLLLPGPQLTDSLLALRNGADTGPGTKGTKEQGSANGTGAQHSASAQWDPHALSSLPNLQMGVSPCPSLLPSPCLHRRGSPAQPRPTPPQTPVQPISPLSAVSSTWLLAPGQQPLLENIPFRASYYPALAFPSQPNLLTRGVCTSISHFLTSHLPQSGFSPSRPQGLAFHSHL